MPASFIQTCFACLELMIVPGFT